MLTVTVIDKTGEETFEAKMVKRLTAPAEVRETPEGAEPAEPPPAGVIVVFPGGGNILIDEGSKRTVTVLNENGKQVARYEL